MLRHLPSLLPLGVALLAGCMTARDARDLGHVGSAARAAVAPPKAASALVIPGKTTAADAAPMRLASVSFDGDEPSSEPPALLPPSTPAILPSPASEVATPIAGKSPLRDLHDRAVKRYATMDTYIMRLKRREVVNGSLRPEEIMACKIRKAPFSVHFKWLGEEGKGREVVYVQGKYGNLIHSLTATGDVLFLPGGKRFKVAPDSFLVKAKSRYPITEAGLGPLIDRFGRLVAAVEKGDRSEGAAKHLGELKRPEFENKVIGVQQTLPVKSDPNLPRGGERLWFFDAALGLPVLIITHDETGREVEYYCHDRFLIPANLSDDDFDPDLLWKAPS